jgi:asparagine synthase (glutamine-hydrolysing)
LAFEALVITILGRFMCGILGALTIADCSNDKEKYIAALNIMHRRGPDDQGMEVFTTGCGTLFLGHNRLSILDLSPLGHQPMVTKDQRYHIVFNGEIYNYLELREQLKALGYLFITNSDTEVLLTAWQEWGQDCLPRLDGMFAFVIYDRVNDTLSCVRDPFGIKPFYYSDEPTAFCFASDVNALRTILPTQAKLNVQRALTYLIRGTYDNGSDTFFAGIEQILPGSILTVRYDSSKQSLVYDSQYWYSVDLKENQQITFEQAKEQLREEFLSSVKKQLRSDVPLGVSLSGGVDSSSIICAIRHLDKSLPINSFSYIAPGSSVNEQEWIDLVVDKAQLTPYKAEFSEQQSLADLSEFIAAHGEPLAGLSFYAEFSVYRLAKNSGIKVMLDGHGADEVIGGYNGYPGQRVHSLLEQHKYLEAAKFLRNWSAWPDNNVKATTIAFLQGVNGWLKLSNKGLPFLRSEMARIIKPEYQNCFSEMRVPIGLAQEKCLLGRAMVSKLLDELTMTSCPPQLKGADRSAMWQSIENRVPFLSPSFVQCALSMPEDFLVSKTGQTKYIFREAMRGIVPDKILDRRNKIGYAAKPGMRLPLTNELQTQLDDGFNRLQFLNRDKAMSLLCNADGSIRLDGSAWRLFNLLRWASIYNVNHN